MWLRASADGLTLAPVLENSGILFTSKLYLLKARSMNYQCTRICGPHAREFDC